MLGSQPEGSSIQSHISPLSSISFSLQRQFQILSTLISNLLLFPIPPEADNLISYFTERRDNISLPNLYSSPQIDKPVLGPIISPSCFKGGSFKFLLPSSGHLLLFPEYFINLFFLLSHYLPLYVLGTFYQHKLAYDSSVLGRKK